MIWNYRPSFIIESMCHWYQTCSWWSHKMETFSALLAFCTGNLPITTQRPVTRLNKWLSKQSRGCWFERPSRPLRRQCNVVLFNHGWWTTQRCEWILDELRNRFCTIFATDSWQRTRGRDECVYKMTNTIHNHRFVKTCIIHNIA